MSVTSAFPRKKAIARILELTGAPDTRSKPAWLVVTVGLPGSGKSTFSRKLAAATGAVRLESDALRSLLFTAPTHEPEESKHLFHALYGAAESLLALGVSVIVDATNLRERDRQPAIEVAARTGANILFLHFRAKESDVIQRLANRDMRADPDDRSTAGMAVYTRLAETEEPLTCAHRRIDTSQAEETREALEHATEILNSTRIAAAGPHTGGSNS